MYNLKSNPASVVVDRPNVNLEFFTTSILGLIGAMDWVPPVFAVIDVTLTGFDFKSWIVSQSWNLLLLTLLMKYVPVLKPVAEPS